MKKIIVFGSNGLLGQTLVNQLLTHTKYQVYGLASTKNRNPNLKNQQYFEIDISNLEPINLLIKNLKPDVIVNALAMTNVDACETQQIQCRLANIDFVSFLAEICKTQHCHLVHISTDFVFDGQNSPYQETDTTNPISYYGWSKLEGEQKVINSSCSHTILRTVLVYGIVDNMKRNNIVLWIKNSLEQQQPITLVDDQFRNPTLVDNLAEACILSIEQQTQGIFHISGLEYMSIYELGIKIAQHFDLDQSLISAIPTSQLKQAAKRPPKTGFILDKAINQLGYKPLTLTNSLDMLQQKLNNQT